MTHTSSKWQGSETVLISEMGFAVSLSSWYLSRVPPPFPDKNLYCLLRVYYKFCLILHQWLVLPSLLMSLHSQCDVSTFEPRIRQGQNDLLNSGCS